MTVPALTENAFQKQLIEVARRFRWRVAHFPTSNPEGRYRTAVAADAAGYPDLTLVRERVVFVEVKAQKGSLRPQQAVWLDALLQAGLEAYIVRPGDTEAVEAVLRHVGASETTLLLRRVGLADATRLEVAKALARIAA